MKRYHNIKQSYLSRKVEKKAKKRFYLTILISLVLLYLLFAWLLPTFIGSLSFLNTLKPVPKKEIPVAESKVLPPPVLNIPFESTSSSKISITGYSTAETKVEIYLDDEIQTTVSTKEDGSFVSDLIILNLGTNNIYGKTVDNEGNKSLASKNTKVIYDNQKPKLDLDQPQDNQTITGGDKKVTVSGSVAPTNTVSVTINGMRVILNTEGKFSQTIDLSEGDNNITVAATTQTDTNTQISRKVTYQP